MTVIAPTAEAALPQEMPLTALRWSVGQVVLLVAWAAALNVGQAFALRALDIKSLPGELPYFIRAAVVLAFYAAIVYPVWHSCRTQGVRFPEAVGLRRMPLAAALGLGLLAVFVARLLAVAWAVVVELMHLQLPGGNADISRIFGATPFGIALTVLVAVVIGPFAEEIVFRGVAYAQLERTDGPTTALLGSSLMFGLLHVNPLELIPLVIAGGLFAWLFRRTRSLWSAVIAHGLFNLVSIVALYALKAAGKL